MRKSAFQSTFALVAMFLLVACNSSPDPAQIKPEDAPLGFSGSGNVLIPYHPAVTTRSQLDAQANAQCQKLYGMRAVKTMELPGSNGQHLALYGCF